MAEDRARSRIEAWVILALVLGLQLPFHLFLARWAHTSDFLMVHGAARHGLAGTMEAAYRTGALIDGGPLRNTVWSYPPPFNLFIAPLGLLPLATAFAVLTTLTLGAYLALLGRLTPERHGLGLAFVALAPIAMTVIWAGQTGFLTGALVAGFALLHRRGSGWAGVPLGAMVIKPHLVLGIGVLLLLTRDWRTLGIAAGTAAVLSGAATAAFGPGIWDAFLDATRQTAGQFSTGYHPYLRTLSLYGGLRSLGLAHGPALAAHVALVVVALAALATAVRRGWSIERRVALAIVASLTVSPYAYDYDAALLGVAVALVARDLAAASRATRAATVLLCWLCGATSFAFSLANLAIAASFGPERALLPEFTLAGLALALMLLTLWRAAEPAARARQTPAGAAG